MSDAFAGTEGGNQLTPAYAYILTYEDTNQRVFLTGWQKAVSIAGLPAEYSASDPQTFTPAQVTHSEHGLSASFESQPLTVMLTTQQVELTRFFATASATRIKIEIIRLNSVLLLTGSTITWDVDTMLLNSGYMGNITIAAQQISAEVIPEPFAANQSVPRYFYTRTCNHVLGDANTCKVNLALFTHTTTIAELAPGQRILTLAITPPGGLATYFNAGVLIHGPSGQRAGIDWSDGAGSLGKTRLKMRYWNIDFAPADAVTVIAGCRHNTDDCITKYNNKDNYGGFPFIPTRNPALYGVGV